MSFLVIGESLVDLISEPGSWQFDAAPGGSPLNVAVGLAAAGHQARLASEVGDDLFGDLIREHLARYGVAPSDLAVTAAPTNLAFARLDGSGTARYDFRFGWRAPPGRPDLAGVDCLHVGSLGALVPPGAAAVRETVATARRRGIPVSYDPNVRPGLLGGTAVAEVEELVAEADIVKASGDDLAWLYPGTPDLAAAGGWLRRGPGLVVVTRGADGAVALTGGDPIACPTPQVAVVDTVGAGDAFTAGLLSHLARTGALRHPARAAVTTALRHATAVATESCTRRGAAPPAPERR